MIFQYKKYKDVSSFVSNIPKSKRSEEFTIVNKCNGVNFDETLAFNGKCFGCLLCALDNKEENRAFFDYWNKAYLQSVSDNVFQGNPIDLPKAKLLIRNVNYNLEAFSSYDETSNIQPWATAILYMTCSADCRISMEVPVFNLAYDRNGRLDICCVTSNHLITMESKTSLDDALRDERFVEQRYKYVQEIEKAIKNYTYLTLIGGKETDFYPDTHSHCSGKIGNKSFRFYSMIKSNNIKFISVSALWGMACKCILGNKNFCWDKFLVDVFSDKNCVGLLSAGKVVYVDGEYHITKI